jgi:DNA polymerase III delta prime subunit
MLQIHTEIKEKLDYFHKNCKIPNIIFHGPSGSGKRTIVNDFIKNIYNNDKHIIKSLVCYVNCAHGKGIKFIREELKFFAKTHINSNSGNNFKSIILSNADKLTVDAQSALRRCIELFSHNTRFFIIVEDKYKLLKPILSRFCEIYIPEPTLNGSVINLYKYNNEQTFNLTDLKNTKTDWLKKELLKCGRSFNDKNANDKNVNDKNANDNTVVNDKNVNNNSNIQNLILVSSKIYEKGYSGLDIINLFDNTKFMDTKISENKKYELLMTFNKIRKEFRNEKIIILFILNFIFLSSYLSLENISFM